MNRIRISNWIASQAMNRRHALYLKTKNPIHAWFAYQTARQLDVEIPGWVLEYFDNCASKLALPHKSAKSLADSFGIGRRGGRMVTKQAEKDIRDLRIVERVIQLRARPTSEELKNMARLHNIQGEGADPSDRPDLDIRLQVAEENKLKLDTLNGILTRFKLRNSPSS